MTELSRRSFAEALAMAALAPMLSVRPETIRLTGWSAGGTGEAMVPPNELARALTAVIRVQYGKRLSSGDLSKIAQQIQSGLERVDRLKKFDLVNGDEPDFVFTAIRSLAADRG
jgi:hypothetical protein